MSRADELLAEAERRRVNVLVAVAMGMAAFVWFEVGRRLGVWEHVTDEQLRTLDGRIDTLTADDIGHQARAEGRIGIWKGALAVLAVVVPVLAVMIPLWATHTL